MKVALVALTNGALSGGFRKYLENIVPLMRSDSRVSGLHVMVPDECVSTLGEQVRADGWPAGDSRVLRERVDRFRPDVIFVPTARRFASGHTPVVTMVRNMEPMDAPFAGNPTSEVLKNAARFLEANRSSRKASRVLAVSQYVRDYLITRWHLATDKVGVVYHGVGPALECDEDMRPLLPFSGDFLFTAGSIRPARGLEDAISAMALIRDKANRLPLVIAGGTIGDASRYRQQLAQLIKRLDLEREIVWVGELSAHQMAWCFRRCYAFLATSRAEACPNTVLEAMSYGCLSISTNHPPMPEFFHDSALYYNAGDANDLQLKIEEAASLTDQRRIALKRFATERAKHFTWESTASLTVSELMTVQL